MKYLCRLRKLFPLLVRRGFDCACHTWLYWFLINLDLAGHERYLKTTLYGLTSGAPSCVILMVGGNAGLIGMSKEHLSIALALSVPVIVCITKVGFARMLLQTQSIDIYQIDMTPPNVLAETVKQVVKILKSPGCRSAHITFLPHSCNKILIASVRKTPVFIKSIETAVEIATSFGSEKSDLPFLLTIEQFIDRNYLEFALSFKYPTLRGKDWIL